MATSEKLRELPRTQPSQKPGLKPEREPELQPEPEHEPEPERVSHGGIVARSCDNCLIVCPVGLVRATGRKAFRPVASFNQCSTTYAASVILGSGLTGILTDSVNSQNAET